MPGVLHTEPRAARFFFGNNDFRRGPVNVDVMSLSSNGFDEQG